MYTRKDLTTLLYSCHPLIAKTDESIAYARGIFVGTVSTLMYSGYEVEDAFKVVAENLTHNEINVRCVPESWRVDFNRILFKVKGATDETTNNSFNI